MNYIVGLDIGIASVGWAVVDYDYNIIETGSNIFEAADANDNVERRGFRQGRRLKRRQKTRLHDFKKLWEENNFNITEKALNDTLELKIKGLTNPLTEEELYWVLLNTLKNRGITYLDDAINENEKANNNYDKGIQLNNIELKTKLPCEIQMERYNQYGHYRGDVSITQEDGDKITLSNVFTTSSYIKEISIILETQKKYNIKVSDEFISKYIDILKRKREYYVGPGNELSRTDYGKYTTKIDPETNEYITEDNIFEKLIGKCSIYPDKIRAAGASYTAQEFNVLNDLNNIVVNSRKLEKEEKVNIIHNIKTSNSINMRKIIQNVIGEKIETFSGARIDKNEKEIFHCFEQYNKMRKELEKISINICDFSKDDLDVLGKILTINTDKESIINAIKIEFPNFNNTLIDCLINIRQKNGSLFNKWQSFSLDIMNELIPELYEQSKNQMQLLTEMGFFKSNSDIFKDYKEIPKELSTKEIYNPVVRRSIRISIDIINNLIKKYGYFDKIVIEMPRDKNRDEEINRIKSEQRNNEKELKDIIKKIETEYAITISDEDFMNHKKLALKLKLWNEQDRKCVYSGKAIAINDLIHNPNLFEIDHIIPKSISFDDSRTNKVIVYRTENQNKGNQTPFMYLKNINRDWNFDEYLSYILTLKSKKLITKSKADKLLFMEDITKIEILKGFIQRNINDTRYASKVVLNTFQSYFSSKEKNTKIKVIRGSFTHQMRVNLHLKKNRDEDYSHHAVDAMLICFSQLGYDSYRQNQKKYIDFDNNTYLTDNAFEQATSGKEYEELIYQNKLMRMRTNIAKGEKLIKYWHRIDKKCNRSLCNQTIRGTRNIDGKTIKINKLNIYTDDGVSTLKKMLEEDKKGISKENMFLMYRNDIKTFENMKYILEEYKDAKNPFVQYNIETGDYLRKYSKKHNGSKVEILKYLSGEIGSCIDISHKYGFEHGSKKVILESLKPFRTDVYYNKDKKQYYLIGLKYSDVICKNNQYVINEDSYKNILRNEKIINKNQNRENLSELGIEFIFSLYKNDIIQYEKNGEIFTERFLSRCMPAKKNYIETKPINSAKFEERHKIGLLNAKVILKIYTDILGNRYICKKENFKKIVDKY